MIWYNHTNKSNSNGIFLTGSGEFNLRVDVNNFIKNGENGFEITTQDLNIDTTTLDLSTDNGGTIKLVHHQV